MGGTLLVRPGVEPADIIHMFVGQAVSAGHTITRANIDDMLNYFCTRKRCTRTVEPLDLDVGIGKLRVEIGQEPADVVEEFIRQAAPAGHSVTMDDVNNIMTFF